MMSGDISILHEILRLSRNDGTINNPPTRVVDALEDLAIRQSAPGQYQVGREKRIEIAIAIVSKGGSIERTVNNLTWKDFEGLVAAILNENEFRCVESFRRRGDSSVRGMEIDVIGVRSRMIVAIDAKMWNIRGGKASALRGAAERQKQRAVELSEELERLDRKLSLESGTYHIFPVLVTWLVEDLTFHDGVPVVPVFKLNSFIVDLPLYEDTIVSIEGHFSK